MWVPLYRKQATQAWCVADVGSPAPPFGSGYKDLNRRGISSLAAAGPWDGILRGVGSTVVEGPLRQIPSHQARLTESEWPVKRSQKTDERNSWGSLIRTALKWPHYYNWDAIDLVRQRARTRRFGGTIPDCSLPDRPR